MEEKSVVQTFAELLLPIYQVFIPLRGASNMRQAIKQRSVNLFAQQIRIERNLEEMKRDIKRENDLEAEKSERGRRYRNGSAIMASVKVSFNFQNSLNPNEDCCQWSLTWTNIQTHIERDKMHYDKNKRWVEKATVGEVKATSRWGPKIGNLMFYQALFYY